MICYGYQLAVSAIMAAIFSVILLLVPCFIPSFYCDDCLSSISDAANHLSSKTPYRIVANLNDSVLSYSGCEAARIVGVLRHGTRTASYKNIAGMRQKLPELIKRFFAFHSEKDGICEIDKSRIMNWRIHALVGESGDRGEKLLIDEGESEMFNIAQRMKSRFPSLFATPYSEDSYYFKHTASQRAERSGLYFVKGLFSSNVNVSFPHPVEKDPILRFYKGCSRWHKEVKKNKQATKEKELFIQSVEVSDLIGRISRRLGVRGTLSYDEVHLMYLTCCFETAWAGGVSESAWCSVFSKRDLQILEFIEDLKFYYIDGYGNDLNHAQACALIENVFHHLVGDDERRVFYFTHSGTLLKTLSHLGLYEDDEKLSSTWSEINRLRRKWRTSYIDTFSNNIFFVLFKCFDGDNLMILHQERPVILPFCSSELCPVDVVMHNLGHSINHCNFTEICSIR